MIKIGTEPGLENIPLRIKEFHPQARIFGVTSHPGQPHNFDEVITTSSDAMLSAHDEYLARGLFVRPELFEQIRKVEGQLIRIADRVLLHDLTTITHPQFPIPKFRGSIDDRSQLVLRQVAYWDFIIDSKEINAIVFQNYGHIGWDVALQNVASARGIPFLFFHEVAHFWGGSLFMIPLKASVTSHWGQNLSTVAWKDQTIDVSLELLLETLLS